MPELLWKAYIDFETEEGERERARALYERLIALSGHVKVWISYALFEAEPMQLPRSERPEEEDDEAEQQMVDGDVALAREVFRRAYKDLKSKGLKSEVGASPLRFSVLRRSEPGFVAAGRIVGGVEIVRGDSWRRGGCRQGPGHDANRQQATSCRRRHRSGRRRSATPPIAFVGYC